MSEAFRVECEVTAPVYPTEHEELVSEAIQRLFPDAEPAEEHGELRATVHDLEHFSELLHRQEILDTARGQFFEGRRGDGFAFRLRKGPALQGVVNFAVEGGSELGEIAVRIRVEGIDIEDYVDRIAPPTEDGEPIQP